MAIKNYSDLNSLELDTLKEIGSIGTGNARHRVVLTDWAAGTD